MYRIATGSCTTKRIYILDSKMGKIARRLYQNRKQEFSPRFELLAFVGSHISPKTQQLVLIDPVFVVLQFEPRSQD